MNLKKKYGFSVLPTGEKKRRNTPPLDLVPVEAFAVMIQDSHFILEQAPTFNSLIFQSEYSLNHFLNSLPSEERKFYRIEKVLITTKKYIQDRIKNSKK